jgi:hypothetical protein
MAVVPLVTWTISSTKDKFLSLPAIWSTHFIRHKVEAIQFKMNASSANGISKGIFESH